MVQAPPWLANISQTDSGTTCREGNNILLYTGIEIGQISTCPPDK